MSSKPVAEPQPFVVKRSAIQGRGCFASRDIRKGERIAEYLGERITWKEADRRYDDEGMGRHHTFLFAVTTRTVIDGAVQGNDARYINHSCDPNCEAIDDDGRIFIEAVRNIASGEEIFYDYAYTRDKSTTEEDEKLYVCLCGTAKCRGTILEPPPKAKPLPATHHVAARHPRDHLGTAGSKKRASKKRTSQRGAKRGAKGAGKKLGSSVTTGSKKAKGTKVTKATKGKKAAKGVKRAKGTKGLKRASGRTRVTKSGSRAR